WPVVKAAYRDETGTVALGYVETPRGRWSYREVDWPEKMEKAANVAANAHGGEFDLPKLKDLLTELDDGAFDLTLVGFDEAELAKMVSYVGPPSERVEAVDGCVCPNCSMPHKRG